MTALLALAALLVIIGVVTVLTGSLVVGVVLVGLGVIVGVGARQRRPVSSQVGSKPHEHQGRTWQTHTPGTRQRHAETSSHWTSKHPPHASTP
jgi:hypothetical protein